METLTIKGIIDFAIIGLDGKVRDSWTVNNIITNAGKAQLALLAGDGSATAFSHVALGSGTTSPAASQTTLTTEITTGGLARGTATFSRVTTTATNDTARFFREFTASATLTVEEVGIFNASSGGTMLGRALTGTRSLVSGERIQVTYNVVFA